jgi:hypothetical protein
VIFTSARPDPDAKKSDERDDRAALWLLPAGRGEARLLADVDHYLLGKEWQRPPS